MSWFLSLGTIVVLLVTSFPSFVISNNDYCITHPLNSSCANYIFPSDMAQNFVTTACKGDMSGMTICYLLDLCNASSSDVGPYCGWFSLYRELCTEMSMNMGGPCSNYSALCEPNSSVKECNTSILKLPSANVLSDNSTSMCKEMSGMTACSCTLCDPLKKYSELCKEMGGKMEECTAWNEFCLLIPDWSICSNTEGNVIPLMQMYFHWSIYDYILFKTWVPYNALTYAVSVIAVFFMAFIHEGFKVAKINIELRWKLKAKYSPLSINEKSHKTIVYAPFDWRRDLLRALYRTIDVTLHFLIMLVTMTFNGGLFIAVVLGYGAGHLVFSSLSKPQIAESSLVDDEVNCH